MLAVLLLALAASAAAASAILELGHGHVVFVTGGGATFPYPQYYMWMLKFMEEHPRVRMTYEYLGSGAGQARFFQGTLDFAGSDPPLGHEVWEQYRGKVMQVPVLLGAVVVTYNLPELGDKTINLTGRVLALIYRGDIEYWDDPRIQELNPGVKLPHKPIIVVYRADASGTQEVFTLFLHKAAPDIWPRELVGKAPEYPVAATGRALGGLGNAGVADIVVQRPYTIGFIEWSFAIENNMPVAAIMNREGRFVKPSIESLQAVARAAAEKLPRDPRGDFSGDLDYVVYAEGEDAYPITAWTHLILWTSYSDPEKARAVAEFLRWIALKGDEYMVPGYAPPPEPLKQLLLRAAEILEESAAAG
ncbi:phosphate ABC transporter substrate-binding protein PstS [Hyperthermus butylicus]|nr:phosphate ABC transporter substrate-binding protein PstS [Hyperthermus butylicus]